MGNYKSFFQVLSLIEDEEMWQSLESSCVAEKCSVLVLVFKVEVTRECVPGRV